MNQQLRDALAFYADPKSYCSGHDGPDVMRDLGMKAKVALAKNGEVSFVAQVLELFEEYSENFFWRVNGDAIRFFALCNDFFWWACADAEEITPQNIDILRACVDDLGADHRELAPLLFCARVRRMRPQGCCYPKDPAVIALFDACGPKRDVDIGNPYNHPEDGGKYAYQREACPIKGRGVEELQSSETK